MAGEAQPGHAGLRPPRVTILSASIGAGHDVPAAVLADELRDRAPGASVTVLDTPREAGGLLESMVDGASLFHSRWGNVLYDVQHRALLQFGPARRAASRLVTRLARGVLLGIVERERPDLVVTTWPGANDALGALRRRGELRVPVVSAITDLASLWVWAAPGLDLHLVTHAESVAEVRAIAGPDTAVEVVRGLHDPRWAAPAERDSARRALGLPLAPPVVVVSGGGWGVGDLEGAVRVALERPEVRVVALCGANAALRDALRDRVGDDRLEAWGFTDRMPELFAAADALIHSTAGLTILEARIRGLPAISYGWGRGHIRLNNRAFERFGLAQVAHDRPGLRRALARALAERPAPDAGHAALPTAAEVLLARFGGDQLVDGA